MKNLIRIVILSLILTCATTEQAKKELIKCQKFIQLLPAKVVAREYGISEDEAQAIMINIWSGSGQNKGRKVGEIRVGANALILEELETDYKIKSPLDGSVGYINKIQTKKEIFLNVDSFENCKK